MTGGIIPGGVSGLVQDCFSADFFRNQVELLYNLAAGNLPKPKDKPKEEHKPEKPEIFYNGKK